MFDHSNRQRGLPENVRLHSLISLLIDREIRPWVGPMVKRAVFEFQPSDSDTDMGPTN